MTKTVDTDIISYAQTIGCGKFGENLFFGRVPQSNKVPVELWWITPATASLSYHNVSGEDTILYSYELRYRSTSMQKVSDEIFRITKEIVGSHCYELDNFHTMEVSFTSSLQPYVDAENRVIGTVMFSVRVYNILENH